MMSHFYGTLQGARGEATRSGSKDSGLLTIAACWQGAIFTRLWWDDDEGVTRYVVSLRTWEGSTPIGEGILSYGTITTSDTDGKQVKLSIE